MKKVFTYSNKKNETLAVVIPIMLFFFCFTTLQAQVGVGTNSHHASSMLEVQAYDKGFLLPRLTSSQRTAITQANLLNILLSGSAATAGEHTHTGLTTSNRDHNESINTFSAGEYTLTISPKLTGLIASWVLGAVVYGFTQSGITPKSSAVAHIHSLTTNTTSAHTHSLTVNSSGHTHDVPYPLVVHQHLLIFHQGV